MPRIPQHKLTSISNRLVLNVQVLTQIGYTAPLFWQKLNKMLTDVFLQIGYHHFKIPLNKIIKKLPTKV